MMSMSYWNTRRLTNEKCAMLGAIRTGVSFHVQQKREIVGVLQNDLLDSSKALAS